MLWWLHLRQHGWSPTAESEHFTCTQKHVYNMQSAFQEVCVKNYRLLFFFSFYMNHQQQSVAGLLFFVINYSNTLDVFMVILVKTISINLDLVCWYLFVFTDAITFFNTRRRRFL